MLTGGLINDIDVSHINGRIMNLRGNVSEELKEWTPVK